ncbi:MAG TPA: hypothetical protein VFY43_04250 [Candidatus Limnocylindria bacterium]|nr:hypothetical protein [Candidatus Limnocylindria bacterium]
MLDDSYYTDEELDGLNTWFQLVHEKLPSDPFKWYFAKVKSGSPEIQRLITEPRVALTEGAESLAPLEEMGIDKTTTITTTIFAHHRGLNARLAYFMVAVDSTNNSASITTYKASGDD